MIWRELGGGGGGGGGEGGVRVITFKTVISPSTIAVHVVSTSFPVIHTLSHHRPYMNTHLSLISNSQLHYHTVFTPTVWPYIMLCILILRNPSL